MVQHEISPQLIIIRAIQRREKNLSRSGVRVRLGIARHSQSLHEICRKSSLTTTHVQNMGDFRNLQLRENRVVAALAYPRLGWQIIAETAQSPNVD